LASPWEEIAMSPISTDSEKRLAEARKQYSALVDKKFAGTLSAAEQAELVRLETALDEAEAKVYRPFERTLTDAIEEVDRPRGRRTRAF
jgi:hypothetical protein